MFKKRAPLRSSFGFLIGIEEGVNLVLKVFAETDRVGNLILQIFEFTESRHLSVFYPLQNNFQRQAEIIVLNKVVVFVVLVVDDVKVILVRKIFVINIFNQFYGLRAFIAGVVVIKDKDNRPRIARIVFGKLLLQRLIRIVAAFVIQFGMQWQGDGHQNQKRPEYFKHGFLLGLTVIKAGSRPPAASFFQPPSDRETKLLQPAGGNCLTSRFPRRSTDIY